MADRPETTAAQETMDPYVGANRTAAEAFERDNRQAPTTFSPALQAMTGQQWFREATEHLELALAILRQHVPAGAQINLQGGTLYVR